MKYWLTLLLCLTATLAQAEPKAADVEAYRALAAQDLRLATIGYRLASANAPFCPNLVRNMGWVLHDEGQYPDLATARQAFSFRQPVSIAAIVAGGPAEKAGMKIGDGFVAAEDGIFVYGATPKRHIASRERLETVKKVIAGTLATDSPVQVTMDRAATEENQAGFEKFTLNPPAICASEFWVDPRKKTDAGADGDRVRITTGMMAFTANDHELAAVAAHELAHNILGHPPMLATIRKRKTAEIRKTEQEADRLSIWLMANAGYDPSAAIQFWQRYGPAKSQGLFAARTHLPWRERIAMLQAEIAMMNGVPAKNGLRRPPLLSPQ